MTYRLVALVVCTSGCAFDFTPHVTAFITCESTSECPPRYNCAGALHRCVPSDSADKTGPALSSVTWNRTRGKAGDQLVVSFHADEALGLEPAVTLAPDSALSAESTAADTYSYAYLVRGTEAEATPLSVTARVVDTFGNEASVSLGSLSFDFSPPAAVAFDWLRPKPKVKAGDTLTVSGTTEAGAVITEARLLGDGQLIAKLPQVALAPDGTGRQSIVAAVSLLGLVLQDGEALTLSVDLLDDVGNAATVATPAILVDLTPPTQPIVAIAGGSGTTSTTQVSVDLTMPAGSDLADAIEVFLDGQLDTVAATTRVWHPVSLPASVPVQLTSGSGPRLVTAKFRDAAGNESALGSSAIALTVDTQGPTVTAFTFASGLTTLSTNNEVVAFLLSGTDNQKVSAYLVNESSTPPSPDQIVLPIGASGSVSDTVTVSGDGVHTLYAWLKDANSLVSAAPVSIVVILDHTPPVVDSFMFTTPSPTRGATALHTVHATDNDAVAGYAVTASTGAPSIMAFTPAGPTGQTLSAEGDHTFYAWAIDKAGNVSNVAVSASIFHDTVRPQVTGFTILSPSPTQSGTANINVTVADPAPSTGAFRWEMTASAVAPTNCSLSAEPTTIPLVGFGPVHVHPWVCDAAGNVSLHYGDFQICHDTQSPTVNVVQPAFAATDSVTVPVSLSTSDDCGVVGYLITENGVTPPPGAINGAVAPTSRTLVDQSLGPKTLHFWVRDNFDRIGHATASFVLTGPAVLVEHKATVSSFAVAPRTDDRYVVASVNSGPTVVFNTYSLAGAPSGPVGSVGLGAEPVVAIAPDNRMCIAWRAPNDGGGVRARMYDANGNPTSAELALDFIAAGGQDTTPPRVAFAGVGLPAVVTWGAFSSSDVTIRFATLGPTGTLVTGDVVNGSFSTVAAQPAVAQQSTGDFFVAWFNGQPQAQLSAFTANGTPGNVGGILNVNKPGPVADETATSLAMRFNDVGELAVFWVGVDQANGTRIRGALCESDLALPCSQEIDIGASTNGAEPDVAWGANDNLFVSWTTNSGAFASHLKWSGVKTNQPTIGATYQLSVGTTYESAGSVLHTNGSLFGFWFADPFQTIYARRFTFAEP